MMINAATALCFRRRATTLQRLLLLATLLLPATSVFATQAHDRGLLGKQFHGVSRLAVNCDRGQRLARAVRRARPGTTIIVRGTCNEQIKITKDRLRIRGVGGAAIDGNIGKVLHEGTVTVAGARRVRLENLEVRDGPDQGVVLTQGASAVLKGLHVHGHATVGVTVDASYAELADIDSSNNGTGFDFFTGAIVIGKGPLSATRNAGAGFEINAQSTFELRGSKVETSNNGGDGITLVNDSALVVLSFPESQGSGVHAQGNAGAAGLFVANSHLAVVGSNTAGSGANVFEVAGHGVGMLFIASNFSVPFATAQFNVHDNGVGILLSDNSDAFLVGGLNVTANGVGLLGDGAGVVRLQQNPNNPSSLVGNAGTDVLMTFGSRIDLRADVTVGAFACDPTSLAAMTPTSVPCP